MRYALHGELLQEKFNALDLITRCVHLCPQLFVDIEFPFFRLLGVILNICQPQESPIDDFTEKITITTGNGLELEFTYGNIISLTYEQVLFVEISL